MDDKEKRLRQAIDDLHRYAEDSKKLLSGPDFSRLLDELYLAKDAMTAAEQSADPEIYTL